MAGAALAAKIKGRDDVSVAFFGDGASNEGAVFEAMNLASIMNLPCIFVAENNGYAEATASTGRWRAITLPTAPPASACPA